MAQNPEKRNNARIKYKSPVIVENLKAGIIYKARMLNYSKHGFYFETDSLLNLGAEVFIGIEYSPYADPPDTYECFRVKIMWRKKLPTSFFKYGYGVKYSIDYDKLSSQNSSLKILEDQRQHQRRPYSKSIIFAAQSKFFEGQTKNISPTGVLIQSNDTFKVGQMLTLAIPLKEHRKAKIKGKVVWSSPEGFGIKFLCFKK